MDDGEASIDASDAGHVGDAGDDAATSGFCGNDAADPGEQCDDGNLLKCDGCESCEPRQWLVGPSITVPNGETWLPDGDFTFEAWAKTSSDSTYMRDGDWTIFRCAGGYLNLTTSTPATQTLPPGGTVVEAFVDCADGAWHHVAATRAVTIEPGIVRYRVTVFWDGQPVAATPANEHPGTPGFGPRSAFLVGAGASVIDEARVSKVVRYAGAFAPPRRYVPDASTALLLHLDGDGKDASGAGHDAASVSGLFANDMGYKPSMCL